jgi:very-short-patch-repair endonuclease
MRRAGDMSRRGEVLVAIINDLLDFEKVRSEHWYRIPVSSQEKWLKDRWPPDTVAFYLTRKFGAEAFKISYYAKVIDRCEKYRWELIEGNPGHPHNRWRYHKLILGPLQMLSKPIISRRRRRIVFIPTTEEQFLSANEINDLYNESSLENRLWDELSRLKVSAERQEPVRLRVPVDTGKTIQLQYKDYFLDFAIYCDLGKINVETDGSFWHDNPEQARIDRPRDNALETAGWRVLRFDDLEIREKMADYCLPTIVNNINQLGGVEEGRSMGRKISLNNPGAVQLSLFDK